MRDALHQEHVGKSIDYKGANEETIDPRAVLLDVALERSIERTPEREQNEHSQKVGRTEAEHRTVRHATMDEERNDRS